MKQKKIKSGKPVDKSGINPKILKDWIQQDRTRWTAIKCQALIALTNDASVTEVCNVLDVTRESLRLWRERFKKEGMDGFITHKKKGKKSYLTLKIKNDLRKTVLKKPVKAGYNEKYWDGKLVRRYLIDKWGFEIAVRTAQNWLIKTDIRKVKRQRLK